VTVHLPPAHSANAPLGSQHDHATRRMQNICIYSCIAPWLRVALPDHCINIQVPASSFWAKTRLFNATVIVTTGLICIFIVKIPMLLSPHSSYVNAQHCTTLQSLLHYCTSSQTHQPSTIHLIHTPPRINHTLTTAPAMLCALHTCHVSLLRLEGRKLHILAVQLWTSNSSAM